MEMLPVLFPQRFALTNIFIIDFELDELQQFVHNDGKHLYCKRAVTHTAVTEPVKC